MSTGDQNRKNGPDTVDPSRAHAPAREGRRPDGTFGPGGNGGRPPGARNRATLAVEALMESDALAITTKVIQAAKGGDLVAAKMVLDRLAPARRERLPTPFEMPAVNSAQDHPAAIGALLTAVAEGALSPSEAEAMARVLGTHLEALMASDLEARLSALEGRRPRVGLV